MLTDNVVDRVRSEPNGILVTNCREGVFPDRTHTVSTPTFYCHAHACSSHLHPSACPPSAIKYAVAAQPKFSA
jgi:hypothetical protein